MTGGPPDPAPVLAQLKGFQRNTVEYAFGRLFHAPDSTRRFLVADEVGLGKTLVARGIIARTIRHLWNAVDRIDVIYICSNAEIARQNINRLNISGGEEFARATRLTLLPLEIRDIDSKKVNFVSLTPGTSFHITQGGGVVRERMLIYWLLRDAWAFGDFAAPLNIFQGWVTRREGFRRELAAFGVSGPAGGRPFDAAIARRFEKALAARCERERAEGRTDLRARFEDLCRRFARYRQNPPTEDARARDAFIGELRGLLASVCLDMLEPDLVILDEFQRFRDLLDGSDAAAELARDMFTYSDETTDVRVLLLSATPYKMYTLAHEKEEDSHYEDFLRTCGFLLNDRDRLEALRRALDRYRDALYRLADGRTEPLAAARSGVERMLGKIMSRTERVRVDAGGDGMLREVAREPGRLTPQAVERYLRLDRVASGLGHADTIEYWKSAPYLFNFMEDYELKKRFLSRVENPVPGESNAVHEISENLLPWPAIETYQALEHDHARLGAFFDDLFSRPVCRTLWLPPSAPAYVLEEPFRSVAESNFTKRLVFSSWRVVPRAITTLTSYEAERRIFTEFEDGPENTPEARERRRALLTLNRSGGRLTGMPVLALMYPSPALAELGDPLDPTNRRSRRPDLKSVLEKVRRRLEPLVAALTRDTPADGQVDDRWYWAAPILLDLQTRPEALRDWLRRRGLYWIWSGAETDEDPDSRWIEHVEQARALVDGEVELATPPGDLAGVLALMAVAGPATAALRAFHRVSQGTAPRSDVAVRDAAAGIGWTFRKLFNHPESMAIIRARSPGVPYWRAVLDYCAGGCLSSVLEEYAHLLREFEGLFDIEGPALAAKLSDAMRDVIGLRTSNLVVDDFEFGNDGVTLARRRLRARFAMRFGSEHGDRDGEAIREDVVRAAFNSPFWPFVLASTSVGQEGLDFHAYCHAVVHWNLPNNPVDMEQREGRVHRFKGHAIRKNVAARFAGLTDVAPLDDPWQAMFEAARQACEDDFGGLKPYWMYPLPRGAFVERHVPQLPLSREQFQLAALRRSLAVYRMVFGQPRQDDLMAFLVRRVDLEVVKHSIHRTQIDLRPPPSHGG